MNNNEYVSFDAAVKLRQLEFDGDSTHYYHREYPARLFDAYPADNYNDSTFCCTAPTIYDAAAWLRTKGWHVQPMLNGVRSAYFVRVIELVGNGEYINGERQFEEYESALSYGIDIALNQLTR